MSDHRQADAVEPPDPFEGLVLDEQFVRSATLSEPSARARMLAERWRREPPVDPGGRRWSADGPARRPEGRLGRLRPRLGRFGSLSRGERWTAVLGLLIVLLVVGGVLFGPNRAHTPQIASPPPQPGSPRPTADRALAGGGTFVGSACGGHGYHRFPDAPKSLTAQGTSGPSIALQAYGYQKPGAEPGELVFDLLLSSGGSTPLALAAPLGSEGVAIEIEGPDGVVAAAYGLPAEVTGAERLPDGRGWLVSAPESSAHVVLPPTALCPGVDGQALARNLMPPTDEHQTITGPAPYTVTVSVSDPEVREMRRTLGAQADGEVMAADNHLDEVAVKPV
ncbi:hypothetical protein [Streptomyces sp. TLI_171]|uniref:SCO2583/SCO2584 N-terminal domain-containing protein n=1 Tax=Streptomyces sp. TLI_171 TaxID=1938859 RepID=UPI000C662A77|nr:hypothetical protein [Streptomyces sp. TLI_171]RKE23253.1 hypothetical protein BX266_6714 [Streptomyces sp. TLI_171]